MANEIVPVNEMQGEVIRNIYDQGELEQKATVRNFRTVRKEGNRMVNRTLTYYNLDAIISVGFRVNTKRGIMFRQWANRTLKEYLLRGYAFHQQIIAMQRQIKKAETHARASA
ncbi:MAG: virulence RhuM family protein [Aeriscardovia sp.]|nr:virulence RhuM family protein [Aeriscardovia sp.]